MNHSISKFLPLLLLTLVVMATCYQQELILYEDEASGNSFTFHSAVPDATIYPFENVTKVCYRGHWTVYSDTAFGTEQTIFHGNPVGCYTQGFHYKSFRHIARRETTEDVLSLYKGRYWAGQETLATEIVTPNVTNGPIQSIAWTGSSSWTLFEEPNFKGKRVCISAPSEKFEFDAYGNIDYIFGLKDLRSVIRGGCYTKPNQIQQAIQQAQMATNL